MNKTVFSVIILLCVCLCNTGQCQKPYRKTPFDSLYKVSYDQILKGSAHTSEYIRGLEKISDQNNPVEKARINFLKLLIWKQHNPNKDFSETIPEMIPDSLNGADRLVFKARNYLKRSMPDKSIPLLIEAMNHYPQGSEREILCRICLSEAYRQKQEYAKGIAILREILSDTKKISDENEAYACNRLAAIFNESAVVKPGNPDSVIKYSEQCIRISERINSIINLALSQNELSYQLFHKGQLDRALELSLKAAQNFKFAGENFNAINVLINRSDIYLSLSRLNDATKVIEEALDLCSITDNPNIFMRLYFKLSDIYAIKGQFREAFDLLSIGRQLQYDFFRDRMNRQINEQSARFDLLKKEQKIKEEQQTNLFRKKQTTFLSIILIILILTFIITIFLVRLKRQQFMKEKLMNAVVETESHERKRIARDLHDGLGPLLSAVNHYFQAYIDAGESEKADIRDKTQQVISGAIDEVSRISHNISPYVLENYGLSKALKDYTAHLKHGGKIAITLELDEIGRFDLKQELALYRCLTELITNTIKHSGAEKITIEIRVNDKHLMVHYRDNGVGYDPQQVNTEGMGLINIRNRVESFGGKVIMDSGPGLGVNVTIEMPLKYE